MPIYEYRCKQCRRKSSHFFRSYSVVQPPSCLHCGSTDVARLLSAFAVQKPWDAGLSIPSAETMSDFDEDDPKSATRWLEGMRRDMGESFGRELEEDMARAEPGGPDGLGDDDDMAL